MMAMTMIVVITIMSMITTMMNSPTINCSAIHVHGHETIMPMGATTMMLSLMLVFAIMMIIMML